MALPSVAPQHPLEASRSLARQGIIVPFSLPHPIEDTKWVYSFEAPSDITLVGSWANKAGVKSKHGHGWTVDVALEMPQVSLARFCNLTVFKLCV